MTEIDNHHYALAIKQTLAPRVFRNILG
jgi:hypothetical protein